MGKSLTGQAATGFDLLGGTWSLGLDYVEQDGVTMDRRSYSAVRCSSWMATARSQRLGGTICHRGHSWCRKEISGIGAGQVHARRWRHRPDGRRLSTLCTRQDGFNIAPYNYSQTPNERISLWLLGSRPIGESTRSSWKASPITESRLSRPHRPFHTRALPDGSSGAPADNFYNPFRVDLEVATIVCRLVEAGNRVSEQEVDLWRALIGLEGSVAHWPWKFALQTPSPRRPVSSTAFIASRGWSLPSGPSGLDDSGRIVCGPPDPVTGLVPAVSIIPGCVPLNLFGGAGSITEEQLAYVIPTVPR